MGAAVIPENTIKYLKLPVVSMLLLMIAASLFADSSWFIYPSFASLHFYGICASVLVFLSGFIVMSHYNVGINQAGIVLSVFVIYIFANWSINGHWNVYHSYLIISCLAAIVVSSSLRKGIITGGFLYRHNFLCRFIGGTDMCLTIFCGAKEL